MSRDIVISADCTPKMTKAAKSDRILHVGLVNIWT